MEVGYAEIALKALRFVEEHQRAGGFSARRMLVSTKPLKVVIPDSELQAAIAHFSKTAADDQR